MPPAVQTRPRGFPASGSSVVLAVVFQVGAASAHVVEFAFPMLAGRFGCRAGLPGNAPVNSDQ
jgi:hypothetical protein